MKKISSFLMMCVLCGTNAFAQYNVGDVVGSDLPTDMLIKIGTAQQEMVPGKWYFLHTPRNSGQTASEFAEPGGTIASAGGFVTDMGLGQPSRISQISVIAEVSSAEGVNANNYMANFVRFVSVDGKEGAYTVQFGTDNWIKNNLTTDAESANAAEYLFYLVGDNENGRFAWNLNDENKSRVDNNGTGGTVSFWEKGIVTNVFSANYIWQLYDIKVVGVVDEWNEAFKAVKKSYGTIRGHEDFGDISNGVKVGDGYGYFIKEYVDAFMAKHELVFEILDLFDRDELDAIKEKYPSSEDVIALNDAYNEAWTAVLNNRKPLAMTDIAPGYYTINSGMNWYVTQSETVYYTQEEADSINDENGYIEGDDGFVTTETIKEVISHQQPAPIKALRSLLELENNEYYVAWGNLEDQTEFLWKVEAVEGAPTKYRLINMHKGMTFTDVLQSDNVKLVVSADANVSFDFRAETQENVAINIRNSQNPENGYRYIHAGGHAEGRGGSGKVVGWCDSPATQWYLAPVDEATATQWIANSPVTKVKNMVAKVDSISEAFPAQLWIAEDLMVNLDTKNPVASAASFSSPYHCPAEGSIAGAFDGDPSTFWHSNWQSGNSYAYSTTNGTNFFVINDSEGLIDGGLAVVFTRRNVNNDHVTKFVVYGSNADYDSNADLESIKGGGQPLGEWTELGALDLPHNANNETLTSNVVEFEGKYKYYKFVATATTNNRGYFHMAEFQLYPASYVKRNETTQYDVRVNEANALEAAIAAWKENAFDANNEQLYTDEAFNTAYNNVIDAAEAWSAVYVDPADLRQAIANVPSNDLFVIGNNPGQWKNEMSITSVIEAAQAYDVAGEYTPEASKTHIDAIAEAIAGIYAQANSVETGKWYRIKFPTEQMYETYGWSKVGAQAVVANGHTQSPALFGKSVAVVDKKTEYVTYTNANDEEAEMATFSVDVAEQAYDGHSLGFVDATCQNGEDMFRFVSVGDSKYIIQNKATGLFIRSGYPTSLSAIPSYFTVEAIGAGACLIAGKSITGNGEGYAYLHAQRMDNIFTTWSSSNLGSNSMLMIEEVEAVAAAPTTEYSAKLWPGKLNAYTMPVDVSIVSGAKAYAAEVTENEGAHTVTLRNLGKDIKAGTPFILVADLDGEYISVSDYRAQVEAELKAELEVENLVNNNKIVADNRVNAKYAVVELQHGMDIVSAATKVLDLQGAMSAVTVKAGEGIVASENGFAYAKANTDVAAYSSYIAYDFDPATESAISTTVSNQTLRTFELSVTSVGYATMYLDYAARIPEGVEAYVAANVEEGLIKMKKVNGTIPTNTGVIIRAKEGTYNFVEAGAVAQVEKNLLRGTVNRVEITTDSESSYYVLSAPGGEVGMYRVKLDNNKFWNNANKAYLVVNFSFNLNDDKEVDSDSQLSRRLLFDFGDETGIDVLESENGNAGTGIFDLSGRRVLKAQKGIYIQNNKKVLVN